MPRRAAADDDEAPRPRKRARAAAVAKVEVADKRGLLMRALLYSPKDLAAGLLGFAATSAIVVNALYLQSGPHPAPMFGSFVAIPVPLPSANPLPRPRPMEANVSPFDPKMIETKPADAKAAESRGADTKASDHFTPRLRMQAEPIRNTPIRLPISSSPSATDGARRHGRSRPQFRAAAHVASRRSSVP